MDGKLVYRHAIPRMSASVRATVSTMDWELGQVDQVVCHQANHRILVQVSHELGIPLQRFVSNVDKVANTVAASVPLAMLDGAVSGQLRAGQRIVLVAFGGGFAWGSTALVWPQLQV